MIICIKDSEYLQSLIFTNRYTEVKTWIAINCIIVDKIKLTENRKQQTTSIQVNYTVNYGLIIANISAIHVKYTSLITGYIKHKSYTS